MQIMPDNNSIALRPATLDDTSELARLHARCFARGWDEASIGTFIGDPACLVFIASAGGGNTSHGFLIARTASGEAEILTLAVDQAHRRQGLARALLAATIARLKLAGITHLFLEVESGNAAAQGLYRGFGAKSVGRRPAYYEHGADASIFSLALWPGYADDMGAYVDRDGGSRKLMAHTMTRQTRLERLCAEKGMRMTGQRKIIARVLSEAEDHPDVEEVYRRANAQDKRISLSTVYRTVRLFEGAGILERHEFGDGRARYEEAGHGHHDHLINVATGEVIEFQNPEIERLQEGVARELGFRLIGHRLELFGVPLKTGK
jgi:Fur family ferric uptake transcriptional regulator